MIDDPTLTITFADLSGAAENRWIRLEQVGRDDSPAITFAEAAALIDDLYDTSPCDKGGETGTGGEASGEPVDEETFLNRAVDRLRIKSCKKSDGFVDFEVDVCRSHQDEAWRLVGERVEIGESVIMTGRKTEVLELEGAVSHDLAYPYYADLRVSGATVRDVRGSTVNFARPVTGRVRVAYTAVWERVTVRVPSTADKDGIQRAEDAAVICFWSRLAATLDLRQPEDDTDRDTLRHICPRYRIKNEGDCYETVRHYQRCNCSGAEATGEWSEDVAVPCPDGAAPGDVVGERREFDGYVSCEGEADEFSDPAHYREHCCGEPKGELPRCEVEREENRGDAEIEGGAEMYRDMYGDDVRLTAVTPEGGCGEIIRTWHVRGSAAGTDPPVLPPRIYLNGTTFTASVSGGLPPFRWVSSAGVRLVGVSEGAGDTAAFSATGGRVGTVTVIDDCGRRATSELVSPEEYCTWSGNCYGSSSGTSLESYAAAHGIHFNGTNIPADYIQKYLGMSISKYNEEYPGGVAKWKDKWWGGGRSFYLRSDDGDIIACFSIDWYHFSREEFDLEPDERTAFWLPRVNSSVLEVAVTRSLSCHGSPSWAGNCPCNLVGYYYKGHSRSGYKVEVECGTYTVYAMMRLYAYSHACYRCR